MNHAIKSKSIDFNHKIELVEKFVSINGEGRYAGELAVFLRLKGCNLRCSYCDTMWANESDCLTETFSFEEILHYITESGAKHVTVTGGEPLLQESVIALFHALHSLDVLVEVETNGSVDLSPFLKETPFVTMTMDYKMPSSGMESFMYLPNLKKLRACDTLKLVVGQGDLETVLEMEPQVAEGVTIYLSPVFGAIEPSEMVEFIIKEKLSRVKIQLQLHKFIWQPEARGV